MSAVRDERNAPKSIGRLLLELVWQLMVLGVPIFLVTTLPPLLAFAVVLVAAGSMWLCARLGWLAGGRGAARLMISAVFGLGFSLGRALPDYWDIAAACLAIFPGLACVATWERRLGLAPPAASAANRSAWGGQEPSETPEGEPIRVFNHGEIAMGGPVVCDYLFPDGVLLEGLGSSARFSSDGRYFAAPVPSRQSWGLVILDRLQRQLYRCDDERFWELDSFNEQGLGGRRSPLVDNSAEQVDLQTLLGNAQRVDLLPVGDLWLEPGHWQQSLARQQIEQRSPDGKHLLEGQLSLPENLRQLEQPRAALSHPDYRLSLDGEPAPLLIKADTARVWSDDSQRLVCIASVADEPAGHPHGLWLWQQGQGWRALRSPWSANDRSPSGYWSEPVALDAQFVRLDSYLPLLQPDNGHFGYQLHTLHSDSEILVGHDPLGREQDADWYRARVRLVLPLESDGQACSVQIESAPLQNGSRARFQWVKDNRDGVSGYRCHLGDWELPGLWQLEHRVSDSGQYLALLPFPEAEALPDRVVVADPGSRRLVDSPALPIAGLMDFRGPLLSVAAVIGRLPEDDTSTPLHRFTEPAPTAAQAGAFSAYREESRVYYEMRQLKLDNGALQEQPAWRVVNQPQIATAEGAFIQPAPTGLDAAWLFGSSTEYGDDLLRGQISRLGGHLLTASGCALSNLAPSMIWSPKGRYLALTRLYLEHPDFEYSQRAWKLLLLDVEAHTLRIAPNWLGNRPQFIDFTGDTLHLRQFEADWDLRDGSDPGRRVQIDLKTVLQWPTEALERHGELWLTRSDAGNASAWQALERPALL
ncbi:hypothetical protein [Pseudomonas vanderleydeniana]|uniref:Uncharacterized protein n=1 Tax=Pseudomonas vanderleydeniana TaxID=2745495 RepID=A0A9E6TQP9_9PSED|nr:hypothetical protein [Pseudomonas vanderleydeniana]QXI26682.1 hypothetical protein HU752_022505 [Pseudomonas vanderleydeniana]